MMRKEEEAATAIQKIVRRNIGKTRVECIRKEKEKEKARETAVTVRQMEKDAATAIQKTARRNIGTRRVQRVREEKEKNAAVIAENQRAVTKLEERDRAQKEQLRLNKEQQAAMESTARRQVRMHAR